MKGWGSARRRAGAAVLALVVAGGLIAPAVARTPAPVETPSQRRPSAETASGNFLAGLAAEQRRDIGAAAYFYRLAARNEPRNLAYLERAFLHTLADGGMTEAFRLAERLQQRDTNNALANATLAIRALKSRQFQTARSLFNRAGGRDGRDLPMALLVAWTHVGSGDLRRALDIVDRFGEPELRGYRDYFAGLMAAVGGQRSEAMRRLASAREAAPQTTRVADAYARLLARQGEREAALAIYRAVAAREGHGDFVVEPLQMLEGGDLPPPLVASVTEGAAEVLYNAADLNPRSGNGIAGVIFLQMARYLHPDADVLAASLGEAFESLGQHERAKLYYEQVPPRSGLAVRAIIRAAYAMEQVQKSDLAVQMLSEAAAQRPQELRLLDALATLHRSRKRWDEAIAASDKAIAIAGPPQPEHWSLYYGRGIAHERAKNWPAAERDFKQALALLPPEPQDEAGKRNLAHVLNYLAYSWVDMGLNIEEAFTKLQRAVALQPRDGHIVDSLGWAYYRLGRYEDAVRELERAVELRPQDSVINDHLGDAYWKVGRRNEARFQWTHARDRNPEPEDLPKILRKLEHGLDVATPEAQRTDAPRPDGG